MPYEVDVHCRNCDHVRRIIIRLGQPISNTNCPFCGCKTLSLESKTREFAPQLHRPAHVDVPKETE